MFTLVPRHPRRQAAFASAPYDCWRHLDGGIALEFRRTDQGFHLRFPDRADFSINLAARTATMHPAPDEDRSAATDLFANQVRPLLAAWEGALVLHASAIEHAGKVLGFLGSTGRGKSTLAAAFARHGSPYLTDDGLRLESGKNGYCAVPSHASVRLMPDSQAILLGRPLPSEAADQRKTRIAASKILPHRSEAAPLRALFVLGEPSDKDIRVTRLGAGASLGALITHSFMLDTTDKHRMKDHFKRVATLANSVPCFALDYPRDFPQLDRVIDAIVECARSI